MVTASAWTGGGEGSATVNSGVGEGQVRQDKLG